MPEVKKRPKQLNSVTHHVETGCGELAVTLSILEGEVFEVFAKLGKQGGCRAAEMEALSRSISIGLRAGVSLSEYYEHFKDIQCNCPTFADGETIKSCPDAISKVLKQFIKVVE
jgi:ribonucleoside-diphosphate reductase alpha chain